MLHSLRLNKIPFHNGTWCLVVANSFKAFRVRNQKPNFPALLKLKVELSSATPNLKPQDLIQQYICISAGRYSRVPTKPLHKMLNRKEETRSRTKGKPQHIETVLNNYATNFIL